MGINTGTQGSVRRRAYRRMPDRLLSLKRPICDCFRKCVHAIAADTDERSVGLGIETPYRTVLNSKLVHVLEPGEGALSESAREKECAS